MQINIRETLGAWGNVQGFSKPLNRERSYNKGIVTSEEKMDKYEFGFLTQKRISNIRAEISRLQGEINYWESKTPEFWRTWRGHTRRSILAQRTKRINKLESELKVLGVEL
jgi:hypothetical protein